MYQEQKKHTEQTLLKPSQSLQSNRDSYTKQMYSPKCGEWGSKETNSWTLAILPRLVVTELQPTTRHIDQDNFCKQHLGCDEPDLNYSIHYFNHNQHYLFSVVKKDIMLRN